jgi:hypothetical protein
MNEQTERLGGSVNTDTRYGLRGRISIPSKGKRLFSFPQSPGRLWASHNILQNSYRDLLDRDL